MNIPNQDAVRYTIEARIAHIKLQITILECKMRDIQKLTDMLHEEVTDAESLGTGTVDWGHAFHLGFIVKRIGSILDCQADYSIHL